MQPNPTQRGWYNRCRWCLARCCARVLGCDAERMWEHADLANGEQPWEVTCGAGRGRARVVLALGSMLLFTMMVGIVWWVMPAWLHHVDLQASSLAWWIAASAVAGVLLHGAFVLIVHDAAHGNVSGHRWDRWLGAIASGGLLLPFVAGDYSETHLRHHRRANRSGDNNWTRLRAWLYQRSRVAYMLYEILPVVNNLDRLAGNTVPRDYFAMAVAWSVAIAVWFAADVDPWWYGSCLCGLSLINAARLWVEHMGNDQAHLPVAHTYGGCVFGFGIGNHAVHHSYPRVPALVLMVGLWMRRHDAHVFNGWWHVAWDRSWIHFSQASSVGNEPQFDDGASESGMAFACKP